MRSGEIGIGLLSAIERIEAEAISRMVDFDAANLSAFLGYSSAVRHLEVEGGVSNVDALRLHRMVKHCRRFPATAAALERAAITVPYLRELASASKGLAEQYEQNEHELLGLAEGRDVDAFARQLMNWRSGVVESALDTQPDPANSIVPCRNVKQRRADKLVSLLSGESDPGCALEPTGRLEGTSTTVDVVIDLASLEDRQPDPVAAIRAEFASGTPISRPILSQLMCDAAYRSVTLDGPAQVIDVGAPTRQIPVPLRRAVQIRDRHCQFQGCNTKWSWCDVHHLRPIAEGGHTSERNLALVCRFHHGLIHQAGWAINRDSTTGQLHTRSP